MPGPRWCPYCNTGGTAAHEPDCPMSKGSAFSPSNAVYEYQSVPCKRCGVWPVFQWRGRWSKICKACFVDAMLEFLFGEDDE